MVGRHELGLPVWFKDADEKTPPNTDKYSPALPSSHPFQGTQSASKERYTSDVEPKPMLCDQ